jgi:hypothetical protein
VRLARFGFAHVTTFMERVEIVSKVDAHSSANDYLIAIKQDSRTSEAFLYVFAQVFKCFNI